MSKFVRQTHRWLGVIFTLTVIANFVAMGIEPQRQPDAITYSPLLPLALMWLSGVYLFVLPYTKKRTG